ncbi:polysaccharide deacetylase family protein [Seonamhaeicola maritimus]|uniref:ChbG/HpnK family deacetylase n=1 Tax=Seonamhaeicola maritimus TaxID=2591822 RepID=A0A5C7GDI4_9FLAO|nr:polysaccharide deacetylase family protein [Seonamhaeicola maritimus]TXG34726.1 ChbG/HpnK family deacetylase [Seonamhaeicola maritimus]
MGYRRIGIIIILQFLLIIGAWDSFSQQNLAEKLGYPRNSKMLIIHADDLGVSHSENMASFEAIENGFVNSASVMMPTPWVLEAVEYVKKNPSTHDFGLHLVLTSEWKNYRWGPVSSINEVPSLINKHGYFHNACSPSVKPEDVEQELRAQIDRAYAMGLNPTHLDSHMGCVFFISTEVLEVYLSMGQQYNLPVLVGSRIPKALIIKYDVKVIVDEILGMSEDEYNNGPSAYYVNALKSLKPGLSTILIHPAYNNEEMKGMTVDHPDWGSEWRQKDFDFFMSDTCKKLLEEEKIVLVTWREIKEALYD